MHHPDEMSGGHVDGIFGGVGEPKLHPARGEMFVEEQSLHSGLIAVLVGVLANHSHQTLRDEEL